MKILHTSDWHIGKLVHGLHMTKDQAVVLDDLIDLIKTNKPKVMIIAGDIYDRSVPPVEAVKLVDKTLNRCVDLGTKVLMIPGNHDSAVRLGFGRHLYEKSGVIVKSSIEDTLNPLIIEEDGRQVGFFFYPFIEPAVFAHGVENDQVKNHQDVLTYLIEAWKPRIETCDQTILIAHGYFGSGMIESESERPLAIGGTDHIDVSCLSPFTYVALGHLHTSQRAGSDHIRYSGSLMKYSFSEAKGSKSVTWIDLGKKLCISQTPLKPPKDMVVLEGCFDDIMKGTDHIQDYVCVNLLDKDEVYEPMKRLRTVYPDILKLTRASLTREATRVETPTLREKQGVEDIFKGFYHDIYQEDLDPDQEDKLALVIKDINQEDLA